MTYESESRAVREIRIKFYSCFPSTTKLKTYREYKTFFNKKI